jgi:aspartate-semialdehyde dehydrogenase
MVDRVKVAVYGATGLVGQQFIRILAGHPWFEIVSVAASSRRAGRRYGEAVAWVLGGGPPEPVRELEVKPVTPEAASDAEIVFIALPKEVAGEVEVELARRGKVVVSNASVYRLEPDIPLLNPEVNHEHIRLLEVQRRRRGWSGAILKVPNCTTAILTLTLKPLQEAYGLKRVFMVSMQAISGAGYAGVPAYAITDNIIPHIPGEEEKVRRETRKILGRLEGDTVRPAEVEVYPTTTRVPVLDGHTEAVYVETVEPVDAGEAARLMESWSPLRGMGLPTAPEKPIIVRREVDRPQPRLDRLAGNGMSVTVGRLEAHGNTLRYIALGHNTIRGAAGTGVLIAELYLKTQGHK